MCAASILDWGELKRPDVDEPLSIHGVSNGWMVHQELTATRVVLIVTEGNLALIVKLQFFRKVTKIGKLFPIYQSEIDWEGEAPAEPL